MGLIYKIVNDVNDKVYIGQTTSSLQTRYQQHLTEARKNTQRKLYIAMNEIGIDHFSIQEIENCIKNRKDWNNQLSSELCLQIGIRLMKEEAYEESRKWFLRTIHKTVSMLDIDSSQVIPNRYLEILDSKKKVHI